MNKLLKVTLSILLIVAFCYTGCKKPEDPSNGGNNGNSGETPEAAAIVSTSEVQYDGKVFVEAVFEDETKMYFAIISPTEVSVASGEFFYQDDPIKHINTEEMLLYLKKSPIWELHIVLLR